MAQQKNPLLRAALAYAELLAWPVFPIKPKGKEPLTPHGFHDASLEKAQIIHWWGEWPAANVGVPTGIAFWVLDIDPRNGGEEELQLLINQHGGLPGTIQQISGGGGRHYLFSLPPNGNVIRSTHLIRPDGNGEIPGIDIKGAGGYILTAPSIHPSGRAYCWDGLVKITSQQLLPAPDWLLEELARTRNARPPVRVPDRIKKGQQHETLFRLGCSMRAKGFGETEIFAALWEANLQRCEEPGPEANIRKLAHSIAEQFTPGPTPAQPPQEEPPGQEPPSDAPPPHESLRPLVRQESLIIYNADYVEPKARVDAILYPGLTILGGRPKIGKSWLAMQLAIAVVSGADFGGYLAVKEPGRCLYLPLEERPRQTRSRLRMLTQPADCLADLWFAYELAPLMAGGAAVLDQHLKEHPVEVVIIDSLLALVRQAGRKGVDILQTDYNIVSTLREVAEKHSISIVVVAHTRKAPGEFVDTIQGTSGTTAAADAVWVMSRTVDGETVLSVVGREVHANSFSLARKGENEPAWTITGEGDAVLQSEARREILDLLRDNGPMRLTTIAQAARKSVGAISRLLRKMGEADLVLRTHRGTYQLPGVNKDTNGS